MQLNTPPDKGFCCENLCLKSHFQPGELAHRTGPSTRGVSFEILILHQPTLLLYSIKKTYNLLLCSLPIVEALSLFLSPLKSQNFRHSQLNCTHKFGARFRLREPYI